MPTLAKKLNRPWKPERAKDALTPTPSGYQRERSDDLYHTFRWTKASRIFRANHPLCAECLKQGIYKPAAVVDHIIPWPVCEDFFNESNWQSLCGKCNIIKGNRDKKVIAQYRAEKRAEGQREGVVEIARAVPFKTSPAVALSRARNWEKFGKGE